MRTQQWGQWKQLKFVNSEKEDNLNKKLPNIASNNEQSASGIVVSDPNGVIEKFVNQNLGNQKQQKVRS